LDNKAIFMPFVAAMGGAAIVALPIAEPIREKLAV
jgi:hypothetical protein